MPEWRNLTTTSYILMFACITDATKEAALGVVYSSIFKRHHLVVSSVVRSFCWLCGMLTSLFVIPQLLERMGLDMSFDSEKSFEALGDSIFWSTMPCTILQFIVQGMALRYYARENLLSPA